MILYKKHRNKHNIGYNCWKLGVLWWVSVCLLCCIWAYWSVKYISDTNNFFFRILNSSFVLCLPQFVYKGQSTRVDLYVKRSKMVVRPPWMRTSILGLPCWNATNFLLTMTCVLHLKQKPTKKKNKSRKMLRKNLKVKRDTTILCCSELLNSAVCLEFVCDLLFDYGT